jgi:hypothetical protein
VTTPPTASPPIIWMSSSRSAVAIWVSPVAGLLSTVPPAAHRCCTPKGARAIGAGMTSRFLPPLWVKRRESWIPPVEGAAQHDAS